MVAYIRRMAVERHKWLDDEDFRPGVALCQAIPGATAMQMAAFVGLKVRGIPGALCSFLGFGLPAFLLMTVAAYFYHSLQANVVVLAVFSGLRVVTVAIVVNATINFARDHFVGWRRWIISLVAAVLFWLKVSPILTIVLAAFAGMALEPRLAKGNTNQQAHEKPLEVSSYAILLMVLSGFFLCLFVLNRQWFDIALLMSRVDLFAFGGGFSSLPLLFHEIVEVRGWLDGPTFLNGIALGQVTPGPIVITATFVGFLLSGIAGAIVATVGIFSPSFLIVVGVAPFFDRLRRLRCFEPAVSGIMSSFVGLLAATSIRFAIEVPWDVRRILIGIGTLAALVMRIDILWVVLAGIIASFSILLW